MHVIRSLIVLILLFISTYSYALVEIGGNFGYDRQVYGQYRENVNVSRTYSGNLAIYFSMLSAIEINYSQSDERDTVTGINMAIPGYTVSVVGQQNRSRSKVYGIGLRQAFAPPKSLIRPLFSVGYAKQFSEYERDITYQDTVSGTILILSEDPSRSRSDSVFGSMMFQFNLFRGFSIEASVKTVFPAFQFDRARDYLNYLIGFSWMF